MSLRPDRSVGNVINLANQLASSVGISTLESISEINIDFFESILENISDFKSDATLDYKTRWNYLLQSLSSLIGIPLEYISIRYLRRFDLNVLHSLLEIIDLLTQNILVQKNAFRTLKQAHNKRTHPDELYRIETVCDSHSQQNSSLHESQTYLESQSYDNIECNLHSMDRTTAGNNTTRLAYLREQPGILFDENNSKSDGASTLTRSNSFNIEQIKRSSLNNYNCGCKSVVKLHAKPLVDPVHVKTSKHSTIPHPISFTEENENLSNQLFHELLDAFPKIDLDEHEERILRKKALSVMRQLSGNASAGLSPISIPKSESQKIEERQRRRLAQLVRHDRQIENLRQQRASETVERRIREEARERKLQLIRARKYFDEFVREFRLKKIAKINTDEQIFRQFFQQFVQKQKEYFIEMRKLEREENLQKEEQRRKIMESLEHEHRIRLELMNEKLNKERDEQSIRMREAQKILKENKRKLRCQLEMNLREMQAAFLNNKDSAHFRERDAKMLLASKK
ncbi:unnamed protein product [Schistosoma turkestanicum]|nr:unnamed protein product [Schistosoma turkestanicum]